MAYGATVEAFDSKSDAVRRSDYIQGILKDAPMLGTEYNYVRDNVLLRVSGELPPSIASKYKAAFTAAASSNETWSVVARIPFDLRALAAVLS